jgi:hypothetical protein
LAIEEFEDVFRKEDFAEVSSSGSYVAKSP